MRLKNVAVKNFRLLKDVSLVLEAKTTVVVGRNNSGKTSLTEVMRRLLEDGSPTFRLEDFSFGTHQAFWEALNSFLQGADDDVVRQTLPTIEIRLTFEYKVDEPLGSLSEFVIDLDPNCTEVCQQAQLKHATCWIKRKELFRSSPKLAQQRRVWCKKLKIALLCHLYRCATFCRIL